MTKEVIIENTVNKGVKLQKGMYFKCTDNENVICILSGHPGEDFFLVDISDGDIYHSGIDSEDYTVHDLELDGYILLNFKTIRLEN